MAVYTQYRKHYKGPSWDDFALNEYNRKLDYRIGRRSVEHRHQPFEWNSFESSGSDVEFDATPINAQGIPHEERATRRDYRNGNLVGKTFSKDGKLFPKQAWEAEELEDGERAVCSQKATQTTHRKHRTSKRRKTAKCRAEDRRSSLVNDRDRKEERVPFVAYGWANDAPVDKKYTHNVRANPTDVYPASLRALKRRELDITKRLEENKKKTQLEREIIEEKFFNLCHIPPMFMTEYQSSYCNMGGKKTGYVW